MKTIRLLLLGSIIISSYHTQAQNLLHEGAAYSIQKDWINLSPRPDITTFFEDIVRLDSQSNNAFHYSIHRRSLYNEKEFSEGRDSLVYMMKVEDSVLYFTGKVSISYDSSVYFENEMIFDYKLKEKDTLRIRSNVKGHAEYLIKQVVYNDTTNSYLYTLENISGRIEPGVSPFYFDSRFGFLPTGLVPFDISTSYGTLGQKLISVCNDTLIYINSQIFKKHQIKNNFCDSSILKSLFLKIIATSIRDKSQIEIIAVFPNPFNDDIIFNISEEFEYYIYKIDGRLMASGRRTSKVNTSSFLKGLYFVVIRTQSQTFTKTLIKN